MLVGVWETLYFYTQIQFQTKPLKRKKMIVRIFIGIALVAMGLLKLGDMWNICNADCLWQQPWTTYVAPAVLILYGFHLVFHREHRHDQFLQRPVPSSEEGKRIVCKTKFGGDEYIYHGETFHGANLEVFCGGIRLDLREAVITEDEEIDIHNSCGGVEIIVPQTVNIVVQSRSFMGGVDNQAQAATTSPAPMLHIIASNFCSGVEIRN